MHVIIDAQIHLTKITVYYFAISVVTGVSAFHRVLLDKKIVVHATEIGRHKKEDQNALEIFRLHFGQ